MRTIDADALTASLKESADRCRDWIQECINIKDDVTQRVAEQSLLTFTECYLRIKKMPTVEPQRMRGKGRWNVYYHGEENGKSIFSYSCNQCGYGAPYNFIGGVCEQKKWNFCPNCGADMREGQDETNRR